MADTFLFEVLVLELLLAELLLELSEDPLLPIILSTEESKIEVALDPTRSAMPNCPHISSFT